MYTEAMFSNRIRIIALSLTRRMMESVRKSPADYKKDTLEYCEAMYYIIQEMSAERLTEVVQAVREGYEEIGFVDDALIADSLMSLALAEYQNEIGEENIYDLHWTQLVEGFFKADAQTSASCISFEQ